MKVFMPHHSKNAIMLTIELNCSTHVNYLMQLKSKTEAVLSDYYF